VQQQKLEMGDGWDTKETTQVAMDTEVEQPGMDRQQEQRRVSPKSIKKMKVKKNEGMQHESSRKSTRRTTFKVGKN
jgi:hypothetical protein